MYYVRLGGGTVADTTDPSKQVAGYIYDTFKFAVDAGGEDEKPQVWIGNVNGDTTINALDLTEISKNIARLNSTLNDSEINMAAAAYCTGDETVNALDLTEVSKYIARLSVTYVNTTVDLGKFSAQTE